MAQSDLIIRSVFPSRSGVGCLSVTNADRPSDRLQRIHPVCQVDPVRFCCPCPQQNAKIAQVLRQLGHQRCIRMQHHIVWVWYFHRAKAANALPCWGRPAVQCVSNGWQTRRVKGFISGRWFSTSRRHGVRRTDGQGCQGGCRQPLSDSGCPRRFTYCLCHALDVYHCAGLCGLSRVVFKRKSTIEICWEIHDLVHGC